MELIFRTESSRDYSRVSKLIKHAFKDVPESDHTEHRLVERLRSSDAFIPKLSIVVEVDRKIIGHILLTKIHIQNDQQSFESLALAPVSVHPEFQKNGIGSKLILHAHEVARNLGFTSIVLLGHADYYPRFGYQRASKYGIQLPFNAPDENCMAIELVEDGLKGVSGIVRYPDVFFETDPSS